MIRPPERFNQMIIAQLGGPALVFGLFAGCARGMGADRPMMLAVATFGGLSAAFWFGWVAWWSRFGSLHMRLTPPVLVGLVLWPFSQLLLPVTGLGVESARLVAAGTLIWHGTFLSCAALWHWRNAGVEAQPQAKTLRWPGISIQLSKRMVVPCSSRDVNSLGTAGWAAAASVPCYGLLKSYVPISDVALALVCAGHALSMWMYAGPLGRMLGQGLRLKQVEDQIGGPRFYHERIEWLTAERRRHWFGRLIQRLSKDEIEA